MKVQKLVFTLTLALFSLKSIAAVTNNDPLTIDQCEIIVQLNNTIKEKLDLTNNQLEIILNCNKDYCLSRKAILNNPNMIGQNTALLACWDKWQMTLTKKLTALQMGKFMQWQSQIDLLGDTPF